MPTTVQRTFAFTPALQSMAGGDDGTKGYGQKYNLDYAAPKTVPNPGDTWTLTIIDSQSNQYITVGAAPGMTDDPTFCFTYHSKEYLIALSKVLFSAINSAQLFNDPDGFGNGYVDMANQNGVPEDLVGIAPFQGRLAFFARHSIQLWLVNADPGQWAFQQLVSNTGAIAKDSIKATGDIDILYLSDTGISSLRARQTTSNAYVDDLGVAIRSLVREKLANDPNRGVNACAVVEPTTGQYWLFLLDTIFVLSYFPGSKVLAWSTFLPTDANGAAFVPTKFGVYRGQVVCRAGNQVYYFGGTDGATYDTTPVTIETPALDLKTPDKIKTALKLNAAYSGWWKLWHTFNLVDTSYSNLPSWDGGNINTYDQQGVPITGAGTHIRFKATSQHDGAAILSSIVFQYHLGTSQ